MADENRTSMGDDISNGAQNAIRMGKNAASTAKSVSKIASQAATGNVVGAAATALTDENTRKIIICIVLCAALFICTIGVFFLYALPTAVFSSLNEFTNSIEVIIANAEYESEVELYSGTANVSSIWSTINRYFDTAAALDDAAAQWVSDKLSGVWSSITNLFSTGTSTYTDSDSITQYTTDDSYQSDFYVTQWEEAETETLWNRIEDCKTKVNSRIEEIEDEISSNKVGLMKATRDVFIDEYSVSGSSITKNPDGTCTIYKSSGNNRYYWFFTNIDINFSDATLSNAEAIRLLSLLTVQSGASLAELDTLTLYKWLGYYDSTDTGTSSFSIFGADFDVKTWSGTFLPQYLYEEYLYKQELLNGTGALDVELTRAQERYLETELETFMEDNGCSAVDLLIKINVSDSIEDYLTKNDVPDPDKTTRTSRSGRRITTYKYYISYTMTIPISIRSVSEICDVAGLWTGGLQETEDTDSETME